MRSRFLAPIAIAAILVATPVVAHPKLLSSSPAPNAVVKPMARLQLGFSEKLVAKFSGADVVMTAMPGMKMNAAMKMPASASLAADGKSVVVTFAKPLSRGTYRVDWHVVSGDTHRIKGSYSFKVA